MEKPIEAVLVGAGQRGSEVYGSFALQHPEALRFVAVAEPLSERRQAFGRRHKIPADRQFSTWEELFSGSKVGAAAFICTQDQMHVQPALAAMQAGYEILLEKPMAVSEADCRLLVNTSQQTGRQLHVAHVLRYTSHFRKMRELLQSGILGELTHISHAENVSWWHMAHSYVRGNWRNSATSAPMILAKCCHDLDILLWLTGERCTSLSSHGGLKHFRTENAPPGAPERCLNGCPAADTCPFYAPFIYQELAPLWRSVRDTSHGFWAPALLSAFLRRPALFRSLGRLIPALRQLTDYQGWPVSTLAMEPTPENIQLALETGPFGRCVYACDNDVVDHQVVTMSMSSGLIVNLTMHGFSHLESRTTRIQGSLGELQGFLGHGGGWITVKLHRSDRLLRYQDRFNPGEGHAGGDNGLIAAFVKSVREGEGQAETLARDALASHLLAFNAERARREQIVVPDPDL